MNKFVHNPASHVKGLSGDHSDLLGRFESVYILHKKPVYIFLSPVLKRAVTKLI